MILVLSDFGIKRLICLESDNESEDGSEKEKWKGDDILDSGLDWNSSFVVTHTTSGKFMLIKSKIVSFCNSQVTLLTMCPQLGFFFFLISLLEQSTCVTCLSGHADETQIPEDRFSNPVVPPLHGDIPQVLSS